MKARHQFLLKKSGRTAYVLEHEQQFFLSHSKTHLPPCGHGFDSLDAVKQHLKVSEELCLECKLSSMYDAGMFAGASREFSAVQMRDFLRIRDTQVMVAMDDTRIDASKVHNLAVTLINNINTFLSLIKSEIKLSPTDHWLFPETSLTQQQTSALINLLDGENPIFPRDYFYDALLRYKVVLHGVDKLTPYDFGRYIILFVDKEWYFANKPAGKWSSGIKLADTFENTLLKVNDRAIDMLADTFTLENNQFEMAELRASYVRMLDDRKQQQERPLVEYQWIGMRNWLQKRLK